MTVPNNTLEISAMVVKWPDIYLAIDLSMVNPTQCLMNYHAVDYRGDHTSWGSFIHF